ncbi:hypothetical protein D3C86_1771450 [compost metagenome]
MSHAHGQILRRAALDDVLDLQVALPVLVVLAGVVHMPRCVASVVAVGVVHVVAADIARHEAQPRHAIGDHVQVITQLPGLLVGFGEGGELRGVADGDVATHAAETDPVQRFVAMQALVAHGEGMSTQDIAGEQ